VSGLTAQPQFTFVQITWSAPAEPNGVIIYYEISYRVGDDIDNTMDTSGLTTSYRISQLNPRTTVPEVIVSAYNKAGKGETSTLFGISTLAART
jgi:hypothetical protein